FQRLEIQDAPSKDGEAHQGIDCGQYNPFLTSCDSHYFHESPLRAPPGGWGSVSGDDVTWAVWTPVPQPTTALLLGIGLVGVAARRRV
ncbi:MAG TPA: PEP-CTERM sorting domain-containing protein, partial [Myxococcales bacterium]|nr:PEP-CTERM sorting domain-containing protein [Myxococcales bacterium]